MHIDFCFIDRGGRFLVAGWSPEADLTLNLMVGGQRLPITSVTRFSRRDLGGLVPLRQMRSSTLLDVATNGVTDCAVLVVDQGIGGKQLQWQGHGPSMAADPSPPSETAKGRTIFGAALHFVANRVRT